MNVRTLLPAATLAFVATSVPIPAQTLPLSGANIVVEDAGQGLYHGNETNWKLTNYVSIEGRVATWAITLQRQATGPNLLRVDGFVRIRNTGNVAAPLGNIVVNLQKRIGNDWVSAAADCADATYGDAATSARIVRAATHESPSLNNQLGPANFLVNGNTGIFVEKSGSGPLNLMDADTNTVFSMVPQRAIEPGAVVNLLYTAQFDNTQLAIPEDADIRPEVLVSFGNASARLGGGGVPAVSIDINGNQSLDPEEARVRTIRTDFVQTVPVLDQGHDSVVLTDMDDPSDITVTGTIQVVDVATDVGEGSGTETATTTISRTVSAELQGCADIVGRIPRVFGGVVTNEARIQDPGTTITVSGAIDPTTGQPTFTYHFPGRSVLDQPWCDTGDYSSNGSGFPMCVGCTFTQGGWGASPNGHNPAQLLADNFATVYPSGVEIGIPGGAGFSMIFTSSTAIGNYLPAGGPPNVLNADLVDTASSSSGVFGGQVLALQLNVDFSAAGLPHSDDQNIGDLKLCNTGTSLDGMTISQILAVANTALGGGGLPSGFTISELNDLITDLNESFDNCNPDGWTQEHICRG